MFSGVSQVTGCQAAAENHDALFAGSRARPAGGRAREQPEKCFGVS